jgi:hypothetical protein
MKLSDAAKMATAKTAMAYETRIDVFPLRPVLCEQ